MKRLSVIIITWNERETLRKCLDSFYEKFDFYNDEIVLIDNGSTDNTDTLVRENYPKVQYFKLEKNIGVGPARNRGIIAATGKYLMTLDNDTIVDQCNFGEKIEDFFFRYPDCGVLGFKLLNADGSFQQSCRKFPGWLQPIAARITFTQKLPFFRKIITSHMMENFNFDSINYPLEVDYIIGANQIFEKSLVVAINSYDEKIFFGPEDFDFCYRAHVFGRKNYLSDEIAIVHDYQRRTRKLSLITLKHISAYYYVMLKNKVSHF
jgi:GT2 family glycosyltransferase